MNSILKLQLSNDLRAINRNAANIQSLLDDDGDIDQIAQAFENIMDDAKAAMENADRESTK